jgi:hypothetical protein
VNGSRDGFPPGDQFEGAGHSAEDKPERENPDVIFRRPPRSLTNRSNAFSSSMSLSIVKLTLLLVNRRCLEPRATEAKPQARGSWPGNLKMPGMAIHRDTWNNTSNQCSILPLLA